MRIDKFLKISRILKRRTTAKNLALNGRLKINKRNAKAGHEVNEGDLITIIFGQKEITVEVLKISSYIRKEEATTLFKLIEEREICLENEK